MEFALNPKLTTLTTLVGDMTLSRVLLENDSTYPWLILVPRRADITEIIDLNAADQAQLLAEINAASHALKAVATFDKLNVAALGNTVAQLHVHVLGRRKDDPTWPKPVFGLLPPVPYEADALATLLAQLRRALKIA